MVSVHHRHFKPRTRSRFDSLTKSQSTENEHVSIYEDDETSIKSGTIKHTLVPGETTGLVDQDKFSEDNRSVLEPAILAFLAGNLDFDNEQRKRVVSSEVHPYHFAGGGAIGTERN